MNQDKRNIIVREIEHWRRSKLLPEHYCDFLANLYAEDAVAGNHSSGMGHKAAALFKQGHARNMLYTFTIMALLVIVVFNFTFFSLPMQIGILALLIAAGYGTGMLLSRRNTVLSNCALGLATLVMLVSGPFMLRLHEADKPMNVALYIAVCALLWILTGLVVRIRWLHFCGWMGLSLVYTWGIYQRAEEWSWWIIQGMWIPFALCFVFLAWLTKGVSRRNSLIWLWVGILQWFIPDAVLLWMHGATGTMQIMLAIKLLCFAAIAVVMRKHWLQPENNNTTQTSTEN